MSPFFLFPILIIFCEYKYYFYAENDKAKYCVKFDLHKQVLINLEKDIILWFAYFSFPFIFGYSPTSMNMVNLAYVSPLFKFINVILVNTNKNHTESTATYGEIIQWIGIWFLKSTITGPQRNEFWQTCDVSIFN